MTRILTEFFFIILCFRFGELNGTGDPYFLDCGSHKTQNINLQSNLNNLFSTLNSTFYSSNTGFAQKTINPGTKNQFNGLIMCYIDSNEYSCFNCLNLAFANATILCPNSNSAIFTYDQCFLRYSIENFIANLNLGQDQNFYKSQFVVSNSSTFNKTVSELLNSLIPKAMTSTLLYAYGNETDPGINQTVFGLVQCTRDLNKEDCGLCLQFSIGNLTSTVTNQPYKGLRVSSTSCYIRYELYHLFNLNLESLAPAPGPLSPYSPPPFYPDLRGTPLAQPPQISNIVIGSSSEQLPKTIGVSVGAIAATLMLAASGIWLWRRASIASTSKKDEEESTAPLDDRAYSSVICYSEFQVFELDTLRLATNNFSDENKLGEGGFGSVYKGSLIDGQEVAVKRLSGSSRQGLAELKNEVDLLAKLKHRNLVQLAGCCIKQKEKLLCYEFLPNGSLDNYLFANEAIRREELNWETRYGIIHGISCGLQYLHEESRFKIIHRDLKASNILLDIDMCPKIADFGLARLFDEDQTHIDTSIVAGTFGYMAPEYVMHGSISAKSDVYSFGVLLLEIVTGRKISSFANAVGACTLISYVRQHVAEGKIDQLKDPVLDNANSEEITKCIDIGLLCVHDDPTKRPSMAAIGVMLDDIYTKSIPALLPSPHISSMPSPLISTSDQESTS